MHSYSFYLKIIFQIYLLIALSTPSIEHYFYSAQFILI